jgi:superfamily I DNA/RNA helicase
VLLARGVAAHRIAVVTFNRDAAMELALRIERRLVPFAPGAGAIEVRSLHAMAHQVLLDGGRSVHLISDRTPLLRAAVRRDAAGRAPDAAPLPDVASLDRSLSAWKVEGRTPPPEAAATVDAFAALMAIHRSTSTT